MKVQPFLVANGIFEEFHGTLIRSNKAYVVDAINIGDLVAQHAPSMQSNASGSMITNSPSPIHKALIDIFKVNQENVSKVVDENGEPKVVWCC